MEVGDKFIVITYKGDLEMYAMFEIKAIRSRILDINSIKTKTIKLCYYLGELEFNYDIAEKRFKEGDWVIINK